MSDKTDKLKYKIQALRKVAALQGRLVVEADKDGFHGVAEDLRKDLEKTKSKIKQLQYLLSPPSFITLESTV